ncbi:uncharacterized protein LOC115626009 [Scaptodrosophila lebanonensis]|uniref:Uncharacterized protein LOC115626009 n=1 Tax=Drosophila lebanonensis TaxID=7225 RepID=A0A6J2TQ82_DROLE|nr:uncharacterized protein LOC115626009 [Scaptodrosophila lebanonensis]
MRTTILTIALCGLLSCPLTSATAFDDTLREVTEFLRLQMRCGYPDRGIPPLAPLEVPYKAVDNQAGGFNFKGNFTDLSIAGLDGFEFSKLEWNNIFHTIKFDVVLPHLKLSSSNYKLNILAHLLGLDLSLWGDGVFDLELINLRAYGSFIIRPTSATNGVYVKSWKVVWELEEARSQTTGIMGSRVYSKVVNDLIKEFLELLINDNPDEISQFMEDLIVPPLNEVLANVAWYEITAVILGLAEGILPVEAIC